LQNILKKVAKKFGEYKQRVVSLYQAITLITLKQNIMYDFTNKTINDLKTRINTLETLLTNSPDFTDILEGAVNHQIKLISWTIDNLEDKGVCPNTYRIQLEA